MSLTETQIKNAKAALKRYSLHDNEGLYLEIQPSGVKTWRYRVYGEKKERKLTIGRYPDFSLKEAREKRNELRKKLAFGESLENAAQKVITFGDLYREFVDHKMRPAYSEDHINTTSLRMNKHVLPFIDKTPVEQIDEPKMLELLRRVETFGYAETARKLRGICGQVFRYGIATGRLSRDPTSALVGALKPPTKEHHARVEGREKIGLLLRNIASYSSPITRYALLFIAYTFVRSKEARLAEWSEIDWTERLWNIPKGKMKARRPHIVPLSDQALSILETLRPDTGHGRYIFPSMRTPSGSKPMSPQALLGAIRNMGYETGEMTVHGLRGIAATELYESGMWGGDAIERQMAHVEGNSVKAAYSYAQYLDERRRMMQWWADYLDDLRGS
jgi:Integrase